MPWIRFVVPSVIVMLAMPLPHLVAGLLGVELRNVVPLENKTTDQLGDEFIVSELSGVTYVGAQSFIAVMDGSDKAVRFDVEFAEDGAISSAKVVRGLTLDAKRDYEGIAYLGRERNSVLISEEDTPGIHEFSLANGRHLASLSVPGIFGRKRTNRGFESLALSPDGRTLWTANEEALTSDGPASTVSAGSVVRLLRYTFDGQTFKPDAQYAYQVEPLHGAPVIGASSGLSELVVLPNGTLIALERSFAAGPQGIAMMGHIFAIDLQGATDLSGFTTGLDQRDFAAVRKKLLWSGAVDGRAGMNLEGLAVGPRLASGDWTMVGVIDDGDPISQNMVAGFVISEGEEAEETP